MSRESMGKHSSAREIVIIGGGIIGCSTAYYLTRHPSYDPSKHKITVLEASKIAGGASGKAGGLLALWAYPSNLVPLSYQLHAQLASEHDGAVRWGYRQVHSGQVNARAQPEFASQHNIHEKREFASLQKLDRKATEKLKSSGFPSDLDWFSADSIYRYQEMGDPSNTAQVHPFQFTTSMADLAREKGVDIRLGARVISVGRTSNAIESVTFEDATTGKECNMPASDVILTAGPWTSKIYPRVPVTGMRAHSVTIRPSRPVSAYVLFTEISMPKGRGETVSPEIYARPNNEVYACGEGDYLIPLPKTTADVDVDSSYCDAIIEQVSSISEELRNGKVIARQACYLPNIDGTVAGPLIGHGDVDGLYIGTGHTCWGIQNGPGTGKLLSEFVFEGEAKSAQVANLDPRTIL